MPAPFGVTPIAVSELAPEVWPTLCLMMLPVAVLLSMMPAVRLPSTFTPIFIDVVGTSSEVTSGAHLVFRFGAHSKAVVVVNHTGSIATAAVVEIVVGDGAQATVVSLQDWADDAVHIATGEIGVPVIQALLDARRLVTAAMRPARKLRQQIIAGGLMLCRPARPGTLELLL